MAKQYLTLNLSAEVASGVDEYVQLTPAAGTTVGIKEFWGSAASLPNAAVALMWDYGGANEECLVTIKVEGKAPCGAARVIESNETDGTKKLALVLTNAESGPLLLSGFAKIVVTD